MWLQPYKSDFIGAIIKEVEAHESRSLCKLEKNSEVNNKHKKEYKKLNNILSIWSFDYWENYSTMVIWISVR